MPEILFPLLPVRRYSSSSFQKSRFMVFLKNMEMCHFMDQGNQEGILVERFINRDDRK